MIHCPHCGAANPDESKFCSACGQPLPAPTAGGIRCPQCGTENDSGAVFCDECGTRLVPVSSIAPESEPMQRTPIKGLSLPKKQTGELDPSSLPDAPADLPDAAPPWLENLLDKYGLLKPEEEEEPLPPFRDRVAEPVAEPEPAREPAPATETEDWLAALRQVDEGAVPVEAEETEEEEGDWLQAFRSEDEIAVQEPEDEEAALAQDEGVSDWLRDLREPDAPGLEMEEEEELPEWLRELSEPEAAAEESLPAVEEPSLTEEEALPDWLHDLDTPGAEAEEVPSLVREPPPAETPVTEEEGLPAWLRDLDMPGAEAEEVPSLVQEPPPAETPVTEEEGLPAWLRDLDMPGAEAEEVPSLVQEPPPAEVAEPPAAGEEGLPQWLVDLRGEAVEEETVAAPLKVAPSAEVPAFEESADEDMPDWLREVGGLGEGEDEPSEPPAFFAPQAPAEEAETDEGEIPEWLQEARGVEPISTEEAPDEEVAPPDWLTRTAAPEVTIEEGEVPVPDWLQGPVPADREVTTEDMDTAPPDWLQEMGAPVLPATEVPSWLEELKPSAEAPAAEEVPPFMDGELQEFAEILELPAPDREPVAEEAPTPAEEPVAQAGEVDGLARAEIPDWLLDLRPREPGEEPVAEQEIVEFSGPLAGIKGVLPVEPIISLPHLTRPEPVAVEPTAVSGDLFAEVVAQPPVSAAAVPEGVRPGLVAGVQRLLIYLLLLAAVVVPLFMAPIYGSTDAKELLAGGELFYTLLDGQGGIDLPAGSAVIVAFDYNPATAAELSLQARAIVDHLMSRQVRIMAISLYSEGAALAGDVLDELAQKRGYRYGEDYIHLGYLPNHPAFVRRFLDVGPAGEGQRDYRDGELVNTRAVAQGVTDLSSVALVIELAGDESTLRTWVEQITAGAGVPTVAGVSAATAPYARPYLDSGQLQALLEGLPGAAEYEAWAGQQGKAIDSLGSQVAAQAVIVLLVLLGNLGHLITRGGKK